MNEFFLFAHSLIGLEIFVSVTVKEIEAVAIDRKITVFIVNVKCQKCFSYP